MRPVNSLPEDYYPGGTVDVKKDQKLLLLLNIGGLILMVLTGWLFLLAMASLRPEAVMDGLRFFEGDSLIDFLWLVARILLLTLINILIHEAIHGLFFWIFTGARPLFAFRWTYAYAAAPGWYLPRGQFLITTLAPLVLMTLAGLALFRFAPPGWLIPVWFILTMNAGGAIGDLLVAYLLLRRPADTLVEDRGDRMTFYIKQ